MNSEGKKATPVEDVEEAARLYEPSSSGSATSTFLSYFVQTHDKRRQSFEFDGRYQRNYPLSNEGWIRTIFIFQGRAMDRGILPWTVIMIHCLAYVFVQEFFVSTERMPEENGTAWNVFLASVSSSALAFLLVFRLNRAATRYWVGREKWGFVVAHTRTLVDGILVHGSHNTTIRDTALKWTAALPIAWMEYIRGKKELNPDLYFGILKQDEVDILSRMGHPPLAVAGQLRYTLNELFRITRDTPISIANSWIQKLTILDEQVNVIMNSGGTFERIRGTPLPMVYVSHLRTILVASFLIMPYIVGPVWGWATIPAVAFASFGLLGIECAAEEVECPFSHDRVNGEYSASVRTMVKRLVLFCVH